MSMECNRCLLSDAIPGVAIDSDGECSVCKKHDVEWGDWEKRKADQSSQLETIISEARRAGRQYDALVPFSGGKDSTYVLYLARKRYRLRCLAVTYDNGFLSDYARANIKNAIDTLEVDHIYLRHNWPMMQRIYRAFFLKSGFFCPACMRGISCAIESAAASFRIPLILGGTCHRTEEYVAPQYFLPGNADFYEAVMEDEAVEGAARLAYRGDWRKRLIAHTLGLRAVEKVSFGARIDMPDYVDWDYDEIFSVITRELKWKAHADDAEHADCEFEPLVNYIRQRKFPALRPELTRYSKLITIGKLTKEKAKEKLNQKLNTPEPEEPELLTRFLSTLDISREQFEAVLRDPLRHLKFVEKSEQNWRAVWRGRLASVKGLI